jgi:hypothetical protein
VESQQQQLMVKTDKQLGHENLEVIFNLYGINQTISYFILFPLQTLYNTQIPSHAGALTFTPSPL